MNKINLKELQQSRKNLTERYKTEHQTKLLSTNERQAYVASRMPATQAVCEKILSQIEQKDQIISFLDLGCGPGSATYAALKEFPNLLIPHLIDQDSCYTYDFNQSYQFFKQNFNDLNLTQSYDLIVISYALNECDASLLEKVLRKAWEHTKQNLVIIEPGTSHGYSSFLMSRQLLIELGAFIIAPCPHQLSCPLIKPDWCHFKIRLQRSTIHRQIKQGIKSFEDESYTYGIFSKNPALTKNRIIKKPIRNKGHIIFDVCTKDGTQREIISRKEQMRYLKAKKLYWGDDFII